MLNKDTIGVVTTKRPHGHVTVEVGIIKRLSANTDTEYGLSVAEVRRQALEAFWNGAYGELQNKVEQMRLEARLLMQDAVGAERDIASGIVQKIDELLKMLSPENVDNIS